MIRCKCGAIWCCLLCLVTSAANIAWFAPFYSGGGYCTEATDFVKVLSRYALVSAIQHGDSYNSDYISMMDPTTRDTLATLQRTKLSHPFIAVCHSEPGAWHAPLPHYHTQRCPPANAAYRIGRTMFETDRLPSGWPERLAHMDEVWVPTQHAFDIFQQHISPHKLRIVPEFVDTSFYSPQQPPSDDIIRFLFVGKWEQRKGVYLLLQAFLEAFEHLSNVELVIVTNPYHSNNNITHDILSYVRDTNAQFDVSKIKILSNVPQANMPSLYSSSHALVIPSHGEGWGRPHVEAMACGTPVIATNWSGPTEYITEHNGYPIEVQEMVAAGNWHGHKWAQPSLRHLIELLLQVYHFPQDSRLKGIAARETVVSRFSYEALGPKLFAEFERINAKLANGKFEL